MGPRPAAFWWRSRRGPSPRGLRDGARPALSAPRPPSKSLMGYPVPSPTAIWYLGILGSLWCLASRVIRRCRGGRADLWRTLVVTSWGSRGRPLTCSDAFFCCDTVAHPMCSKAGQTGSRANTVTCKSVNAVSPRRTINLKTVFMETFYRLFTARRGPGSAVCFFS